MPLSVAASSYFHTRKDLDTSNLVLTKIKDAASPSIPFIDSFETISKNDGIVFISLDPSESELQLFHHGVILGGSWTYPEKQLVTIIASDNDSKPIQILPKFIKDFKCKTNSADDFIACLANAEKFANLKNPKTDLYNKNIIPIPNLLTKAFLETPLSVAMKFLETMLTYDTVIENETDNNDTTPSTNEPDIIDETASENSTSSNTITKQDTEKFLPSFIHIIQFCHLCFKGKIPPVHYKIISTDEVNKWFSYVLSSCNLDA
jgi:hypothetical protein